MVLQMSIQEAGSKEMYRNKAACVLQMLLEFWVPDPLVCLLLKYLWLLQGVSKLIAVEIYTAVAPVSPKPVKS